MQKLFLISATLALLTVSQASPVQKPLSDSADAAISQPVQLQKRWVQLAGVAASVLGSLGGGAIINSVKKNARDRAAKHGFRPDEVYMAKLPRSDAPPQEEPQADVGEKRQEKAPVPEKSAKRQRQGSKKFAAQPEEEAGDVQAEERAFSHSRSSASKTARRRPAAYDEDDYGFRSVSPYDEDFGQYTGGYEPKGYSSYSSRKSHSRSNSRSNSEFQSVSPYDADFPY